MSVFSFTRARKIVMIAGWSALSLCYYKGLTPKLHFHWGGEYLKIKDLWCTWSGSPTHLLLSRCTWHQKMAIAWDEVVRDWRDMAPGLVFCDTGFLCCAVFFPWHQGAYSPTPPLEGDSLEVEKEKKQGKRWRRGLVSATRCRAMWPFYRTSSMNVFNTLLGLGWHKHVFFADHSYWLVIETEYFTNY